LDSADYRLDLPTGSSVFFASFRNGAEVGIDWSDERGTMGKEKQID